MATKSKSDKADYKLSMKEAYDLVHLWADMEFNEPKTFHFSDVGKFNEMCKSEGIFDEIDDWWFAYRDRVNCLREKNNQKPLYRIKYDEEN